MRLSEPILLVGPAASAVVLLKRLPQHEGFGVAVAFLVAVATPYVCTGLAGAASDRLHTRRLPPLNETSASAHDGEPFFARAWLGWFVALCVVVPLAAPAIAGSMWSGVWIAAGMWLSLPIFAAISACWKAREL